MGQIKTLSDFVEEISDDFLSTFTVIDKNTLANMLGMPGDFDSLKDIILKYMPGALITFSKTGKFDDDYDIYLVYADRDELLPYGDIEIH